MLKISANQATGMQIKFGFTLVELLVTLSVLAILIALAIPSYSSITKQNALTAFHNDLVHAVRSARITAITNKENSISICALAADAAAASPCGAGKTTASGWSNGFVILKGKDSFVESDVIKYSEKPSSFMEIQTTGFSANMQRIEFSTLGVRQEPAANVTLAVCDKAGDVKISKTITISKTQIEVTDVDSCN